MRNVRGAGLALGLAALLGCVPIAGAAAAPQPAWAAENDATMARMHDAMMETGPAATEDQAFAAQMIPHHLGAVAMARTELAYGHDPQMRALARGIVAAQDREIARMRRWLAAHGPAPGSAGTMAAMPRESADASASPQR